MKILYLSQHFRTLERGGGTRGYELGRRWVEAGHSVTVVAGARAERGEPVRRDDYEGIDVHTLPVAYEQSMGYLRRVWSFASFVWKSTQYARNLDRHDVVLATSAPLTIAIPGLIAARSHSTHLVFEVRDLWPEVPIAMGVIPTPPLRWLAKGLEKLVYRSSHHVVALSPGMAEGVVAAGKDESAVSVIPNASDVDLFDVPVQTGLGFRAEQAWIGDGPLIVYTGTLGPANDASWIVDLAVRVTRQIPEARFLLVGEGNEKEEIAAYAVEQGVGPAVLQIWGHLSKLEIVRVLSAADLALSVFAPLRELRNNSPNKAFDAFAAGTPVAINNGGWLAEVLKESGAGISMPHADPDGAATMVCDLLKDPEAMEDARTAARKLAKGPFNRNRHAKVYVEILEAAAQDRPAKAVRFAVEHGSP